MQVLEELAIVSGVASALTISNQCITCPYLVRTRNQCNLPHAACRHFTLGKLRSDFPSRVEAYSDRLEYYFKVHTQHCQLIAAFALSWCVDNCRMVVASQLH